MKLLICVFLSVCLHSAYSVLTEKQLKSTGKLMRNTCQPRSKVTDAQIEGLHQGNWDDDPNIMCYLHCVMKLLKLAKADGKFDKESALAQLPTLPEPRREPTLKSMEACAPTSVDGKDPCETSYIFIKCVYFNNPENYFLP